MKRYFQDPRRRKGWYSILTASLLAFVLLGFSNILIAGASTPIDIGYFDFLYPRGTGKNGEPTGEKPENKLWYHDGSWWGSMWSVAGDSYHIYRLDWDTQTWFDTGVALDDRIESRADVLSDGDTLYVVSHLYQGTGETTAFGSRGELFRYTYSGGTYSLDPDFPIEITDSRGEAHVIAKDSTGMLWVTYVTEGRVMITHSNADGGGDTDWATPFIVPVAGANVSDDDISSVVTFDGHIGVMWSAQSGGSLTMQFASHVDGDDPTVWTGQTAFSASGDDHISMRSLQTDDAGRIFSLIKNGGNVEQTIVLLVCSAISTSCAGPNDWTAYPVYTPRTGDPTRAVMSIDLTNRDIYVFTRMKLGGIGSDIYYKKSDLDNIAFPAGLGTPVISSPLYRSMNNVTTTKQNVTSDMGLVIQASDDRELAYVHGCIDLSDEGSLQCLSPNSVVGARFSSPLYQVNEVGGLSMTVTVENPVLSALPLSIDYATSNGTAIAGQDYMTATGTLVFASGEMTKTFEIGIIDDGLFEDPETINLTLSNGPTVFPDTAVVTIYDDEKAPAVSFSHDNYDALEDLEEGEFTVDLNVPYYLTVTVDYATSNNTAIAPADYAATSGTLTFFPGETTKTVDVTLVDDGLLEPTETISLTLSNPTNAILGTLANSKMSILDDDDPPNVMFTSDSFVVDENGGAAMVTVMLDSTADGIVTIDYATKDVSAVSPADYTAIPTTTLTFNPGETIKTFGITVIDDVLEEFSESAMVILENPVGANLVAPSKAIVAILDDDTPPVVRLKEASYNAVEQQGWIEIDLELSFPFDATMTVDIVAHDETALVGFDYTPPLQETVTFNPFETEKTIIVPIIEDINYELPETFKVELVNPVITTLSIPNEATVTIFDNDVIPAVSFAESAYSFDESIGLATVELELNGTSHESVSVRVLSTDNTAVSPLDYGAVDEIVTFAPGVTTMPLQISVVDETILEPSEGFVLTLIEPSRASLGTQQTTAVTVLDNDQPPTVQFAQLEYEVTENSGTPEIAVTLSSEAIAPVTVDFQSSDIEAVGGVDYEVVSATLTFAPGETVKPILLPILDDVVEENNESLTLTLSNVTGADLGTPNVATVEILDNEVPPVVQFATATAATSESDGTVTVDVVLANPSEDVVTVDYQAFSATAVVGEDLVNAVGTLTFAPGELTQSIVVTINDDNIRELTETFELVLSNWSDTALPGSRMTMEISIADNDEDPTIFFSGFSYAIVESDGDVEISVSMSHPSSIPVSVDYVLTAGSATAGVDYAGTDGTLTMPPGTLSQSFTITALPDELDEDDEIVLLSLENPVGATTVVPNNAALTIVDDDATPVIAFSTDVFTVTEDGVTAVLEVNLSSASGKTIMVPYALTNSTATAGQDFVLGDEDHITFIPGETNEKFTIQIVDDAISEISETIVIDLLEAEDVILGDPKSAIVTIEDNDAAGVQFEKVELIVSEGDAEAMIVVGLTKAHGAPFSVNIMTSNGSAIGGEDYFTIATTLNFAATELNKNVAVPLIEDLLDEGDETFIVTLDTPEGIQLGSNTFMQVTIEDNDEPPTVSFTRPTYREFEGNGAIDVRVALSTTSGRPVSVQYATSDNSATGGSDYTITNGTVVFAPGEIWQTISIPLLADEVEENEENFLLILSSPDGATPGEQMIATLSLRDGKGALLYLPILFK